MWMLVEKEFFGSYVYELEVVEANALMLTEIFVPEVDPGSKVFEIIF